MRDPIKKALTQTISLKGTRGRTQQIEITPSQKFVFGIYFAIASLIALTFLEAIHILVVKTFSTEIFAAISLVVGTILGAVFGQKA